MTHTIRREKGDHGTTSIYLDGKYMGWIGNHPQGVFYFIDSIKTGGIADDRRKALRELIGTVVYPPKKRRKR